MTIIVHPYVYTAYKARHQVEPSQFQLTFLVSIQSPLQCLIHFVEIPIGIEIYQSDSNSYTSENSHEERENMRHFLECFIAS